MEMSALKPVDIPNQYKEAAQEALQDVMDENPDTVIILSFWKDRGQFKIKTSMVPDRLMLIGAIEEAKAKVISDGYAS
jgi:hypothetical protein|tara:strand:- start:16 stop:249 length:234 start_codon:yes stop_codon:yes gene_type:complete